MAFSEKDIEEYERTRIPYAIRNARADRSMPCNEITRTPEEQARHDAHWASIGPRIAALHDPNRHVLPPKEEVIEPIA